MAQPGRRRAAEARRRSSSRSPPALIRDERGRYLITQRRRGSHLEGLWEFPGGKVEAGETPAACLRRELIEELSATFAVGELVETVRWEYPDRTVVLHFFECRLESGDDRTPRAAGAWSGSSPLGSTDYDFPPADHELIERLRLSGKRPA